MIHRIFAGVCAIALTTGAAMAGGTANTAKQGEDKKICRSDPSVGSRLKRTRTCHTKAEWAEIRRQTKQEIDQIQRQPPISGN